MAVCKELYEMIVELVVIVYIMLMSVFNYVSFEAAIPTIAAIAGLTISSVHTINNKDKD